MFVFSEPAIEKLIRLSFEAKDNAYAPYSNFPVGSAVLCKDGTYYKGTGISSEGPVVDVTYIASSLRIYPL